MTKQRSSSSPESETSAPGTRYAGLTRSSANGRASWLEAPADLLVAALENVTVAGDLLSLSRTRDGGALCIFIKSGAEEFKTYAATQEELNEALAVLAASS